MSVGDMEETPSICSYHACVWYRRNTTYLQLAWVCVISKKHHLSAAIMSMCDMEETPPICSYHECVCDMEETPPICSYHECVWYGRNTTYLQLSWVWVIWKKHHPSAAIMSVCDMEETPPIFSYHECVLYGRNITYLQLSWVCMI